MAYKSPLRYSSYKYSYYGQRELTDAQIRKEYSRLRSIAKKRLERISKTELKETQTYLNYSRQGFPTLKELSNRNNIQAAFNRVASFLRTDTTVSGLRREMMRRLEVLHSHGYNFIDIENQWDFYRFMHYAQKLLKHLYYDSDKLVEAFYNEYNSDEYNLGDLEERFKNFIEDRENYTGDEFADLILDQTPQDINKLRRGRRRK